MALNRKVVAWLVGVPVMWQMHPMLDAKRKKRLLLSRDAATKHGRPLLAGASMLAALALAHLACASARAALLVWAHPRTRPAVAIADSDMLLALLLRGVFYILRADCS